jgi:hypothetical protein
MQSARLHIKRAMFSLLDSLLTVVSLPILAIGYGEPRRRIGNESSDKIFRKFPKGSNIALAQKR